MGKESKVLPGYGKGGVSARYRTRKLSYYLGMGLERKGIIGIWDKETGLKGSGVITI